MEEEEEKHGGGIGAEGEEGEDDEKNKKTKKKQHKAVFKSSERVKLFFYVLEEKIDLEQRCKVGIVLHSTSSQL